MSAVTHINDFISENLNSTVNLNKLYKTILTVNHDNIKSINRIPYDDFFIRYRRQLNQIVSRYIITPDYYYKPKSVSQLLYGTTEIWLGLLRLNNMKSVTDFDKDIINIYNPHQLYELIEIFFKRENIF